MGRQDDSPEFQSTGTAMNFLALIHSGYLSFTYIYINRRDLNVYVLYVACYFHLTHSAWKYTCTALFPNSYPLFFGRDFHSIINLTKPLKQTIRLFPHFCYECISHTCLKTLILWSLFDQLKTFLASSFPLSFQR